MGEILSRMKVAAVVTGAAMFVVACGGQQATESAVDVDDFAADASAIETIDGDFDAEMMPFDGEDIAPDDDSAFEEIPAEISETAE